METIMLTKGSEKPFKALLRIPDDASQGVVLIHEAWGLTPQIEKVAERLAGEGFAVIAPELLEDQPIVQAGQKLQRDLYDPARQNTARERLRELTAPLHDEAFVRRTIDRLKLSFDTLVASGNMAGHVSAIGYSMGGTYAFQLAVEEPLLKAAVSFYGHAPLRSAKLEWIACPVLAIYGELDESLMNQYPAAVEAMESAHVAFETKLYDGAGHDFCNDDNELTYQPDAAEDAWRTAMSFIRFHG